MSEYVTILIELPNISITVRNLGGFMEKETLFCLIKNVKLLRAALLYTAGAGVWYEKHY